MTNIDVVDVSFPGGKKITAIVDGHVVQTDQPERAGGENSAPQPLSLFLVSLATCAGTYAQEFCHARKIATEGMKLTVRCVWDSDQHRYTGIKFELALPKDFPEKYRRAIVRAMNLCTVKRCILDPPEFEVETV
ncbi:MAG: osmotically inducible protein OsmC [Kiritimatiellaeota bacterium]|nr:osmotically inducible protein OsmC [Kiritimatiellota bacterium]